MVLRFHVLILTRIKEQLMRRKYLIIVALTLFVLLLFAYLPSRCSNPEVLKVDSSSIVVDVRKFSTKADSTKHVASNTESDSGLWVVAEPGEFSTAPYMKKIIRKTCPVCGMCKPEIDGSISFQTTVYCPDNCCNTCTYSFRCTSTGKIFSASIGCCDSFEWGYYRHHDLCTLQFWPGRTPY